VLLDPRIVRGHHDLGHGPAGGRLFIHLLDDGFATEQGNGFPWEA
jgi:hypothetical protein